MNPDLPLRDIHLPEPISWWPAAPGWWLLLLAVVTFLLFLVFAWRRWREPGLRALALRELALIEGAERAAQYGRLAILLRRVCIALYPREQVAGLSGEAWLDRLAQVSGDERFSEGAGRLLLDSPYRRASEADPGELFALCRAWFKRLPRSVKRKVTLP